MIPKRVVETALFAGLQHEPNLLEQLVDIFAALGHPLDLGRMTPDARTDFGAVDAKMDRLLAEKSDADELQRKHHKPSDDTVPDTERGDR